MEQSIAGNSELNVEAKRASQPNTLTESGAENMSPRFWLLIVFTGVTAGITSGLLMNLLHFVEHLSFAYAAGDFLSGVRASSGPRRVIVVSLAGLFVGVSLYLLRRFVPGKGGDITSAIWHKQGRFPIVPILGKSFISIISVGLGAAVGREAALKDVAASVALRVSDWARLSPQQTRLLVACGAGAGMAAAYNVPMGGALFAVEVLLGTISLTAVLAATTTSFLAVAVSWLLLPNVTTFLVAPRSVSLPLLVWAALAGPVLGIASAFYVRVIGWAEKGRPTGLFVIAVPIVVFFGLGMLSVQFPEVLGNGKDVVQEAFGSRLGPGLLVWLLVLRPLATSLCLKSGAPGGLFTPTMTFGALLGAVLGEGWSYLTPAISKDTYAIVGAGAMIASASQGPISAVVFMLELTDHTNTLIVPLLIAVSGATLTARWLETHSIYSVRE